MDFRTPEGPRRYADLVDSAEQGVICLDYDGVLAPIVEDPAAAYIHPGAGDLLPRLAAAFRAVAVVTGRPAQQALDLGRLDPLADHIAEAGGTLLVLGQYGNERWSSADRQVISPP